MRPLACALVASVIALPAAPAGAATLTGAATDALGDSRGGPGTDINHTAVSFDPDAGRFVVAVTFVAKPAGKDWGEIGASLHSATGLGCDAAAFGVLRGSNKGNDATASVGTTADGGASSAPATNVKSNAGRTTTLTVTHARLVGRKAACLIVTVSRGSTRDVLTLRLREPSPYEIPQAGTPSRPGDPTTVRLATSQKLKFRRNRARVTLTGVKKGMAIRLALRLKRGATIATGEHTAKRNAPVLARLTLTPAGRRWLRRHRRGSATLTVTTTLGTASATRRYTVQFRR